MFYSSIFTNAKLYAFHWNQKRHYCLILIGRNEELFCYFLSPGLSQAFYFCSIKAYAPKPYFMYSIWIQRHYKPYSCWHKLLLFFYFFLSTSLSQSFTAVLLRHIYQCQTLYIPVELKGAKILFLLAKLKKQAEKKYPKPMFDLTSISQLDCSRIQWPNLSLSKLNRSYVCIRLVFRRDAVRWNRRLKSANLSKIFDGNGRH
jgi:hypothetical protein